mmetsp:Transcript_31139/g.91198  ORF Transcript_31139/g.91198 Transcript_31139/m.91198 type:complete len:258 (+) Transcript_31139:20-793(+)
MVVAIMMVMVVIEVARMVRPSRAEAEAGAAKKVRWWANHKKKKKKATTTATATATAMRHLRIRWRPSSFYRRNFCRPDSGGWWGPTSRRPSRREWRRPMMGMMVVMEVMVVAVVRPMPKSSTPRPTRPRTRPREKARARAGTRGTVVITTTTAMTTTTTTTTASVRGQHSRDHQLRPFRKRYWIPIPTLPRCASPSQRLTFNPGCFATLGRPPLLLTTGRGMHRHPCFRPPLSIHFLAISLLSTANRPVHLSCRKWI